MGKKKHKGSGSKSSSIKTAAAPMTANDNIDTLKTATPAPSPAVVVTDRQAHLVIQPASVPSAMVSTSSSVTPDIKLYQEQAEQKNHIALHNMAWCHYHGNGVVKDEKLAIEYLNKAAELGNSCAKQALIYLLLINKSARDSKDKLEKDTLVKIEKLILELVVLPDASPRVLVLAGILYLRKGYFSVDQSIQQNNYDKAIEYFKQAADQKDPAGQYYYGFSLINGLKHSGRIIQDDDRRKGYRYIELAAKAKYPKALYCMGLYHYESCVNVDPDKFDDEKGIKELTEAAKLNCPIANAWFGKVYYFASEPWIKNQDQQLALEYFKKALAFQPEPAALFFVAYNKIERKGNKEEIVAELTRAAEMGHEVARDQLISFVMQKENLKFVPQLKSTLSFIKENKIKMLLEVEWCEEFCMDLIFLFRREVENYKFELQKVVVKNVSVGVPVSSSTPSVETQAVQVPSLKVTHHIDEKVNEAKVIGKPNPKKPVVILNNLAISHFLGQGVVKDEKLALSYLDQAILEGNIYAELNKFIYTIKNNADVTLESSLKVLLRAKELDIPVLNILLGICYLRLSFIDSAKKNAAKERFEKAADKMHADGEYYLGLCLETEGDVVRSNKLYQQAAARGHAAAKMLLICQNKQLSPLSKFTQLAPGLRQNAFLASRFVADLYRTGNADSGIGSNASVAADYYKRVAEQYGDPYSQYWVAVEDLEYPASKQDGIKALQNLARLGYKEAIERLSEMKESIPEITIQKRKAADWKLEFNADLKIVFGNILSKQSYLEQPQNYSPKPKIEEIKGGYRADPLPPRELLHDSAPAPTLTKPIEIAKAEPVLTPEQKAAEDKKLADEKIAIAQRQAEEKAEKARKHEEKMRNDRAAKIARLAKAEQERKALQEFEEERKREAEKKRIEEFKAQQELKDRKKNAGKPQYVILKQQDKPVSDVTGDAPPQLQMSEKDGRRQNGVVQIGNDLSAQKLSAETVKLPVIPVISAANNNDTAATAVAVGAAVAPIAMTTDLTAVVCGPSTKPVEKNAVPKAPASQSKDVVAEIRITGPRPISISTTPKTADATTTAPVPTLTKAEPVLTPDQKAAEDKKIADEKIAIAEKARKHEEKMRNDRAEKMARLAKAEQERKALREFEEERKREAEKKRIEEFKAQQELKDRNKNAGKLETVKISAAPVVSAANNNATTATAVASGAAVAPITVKVDLTAVASGAPTKPVDKKAVPNAPASQSQPQNVVAEIKITGPIIPTPISTPPKAANATMSAAVVPAISVKLPGDSKTKSADIVTAAVTNKAATNNTDTLKAGAAVEIKIAPSPQPDHVTRIINTVFKFAIYKSKPPQLSGSESIEIASIRDNLATYLRKNSDNIGRDNLIACAVQGEKLTNIINRINDSSLERIRKFYFILYSSIKFEKDNPFLEIQEENLNEWLTNAVLNDSKLASNTAAVRSVQSEMRKIIQANHNAELKDACATLRRGELLGNDDISLLLKQIFIFDRNNKIIDRDIYVYSPIDFAVQATYTKPIYQSDRLGGILSQIKKDRQNASATPNYIIYVPINLWNGHWALLRITVKEAAVDVSYWDSMYYLQPSLRLGIMSGIQFEHQSSNAQERWEAYPKAKVTIRDISPTVRQKDSWSCGYRVAFEIVSDICNSTKMPLTDAFKGILATDTNFNDKISQAIYGLLYRAVKSEVVKSIDTKEAKASATAPAKQQLSPMATPPAAAAAVITKAALTPPAPAAVAPKGVAPAMPTPIASQPNPAIVQVPASTVPKLVPGPATPVMPQPVQTPVAVAVPPTAAPAGSPPVASNLSRQPVQKSEPLKPSNGVAQQPLGFPPGFGPRPASGAATQGATPMPKVVPATPVMPRPSQTPVAAAVLPAESAPVASNSWRQPAQQPEPFNRTAQQPLGPSRGVDPRPVPAAQMSGGHATSARITRVLNRNGVVSGEVKIPVDDVLTSRQVLKFIIEEDYTGLSKFFTSYSLDEKTIWRRVNVNNDDLKDLIFNLTLHYYKYKNISQLITGGKLIISTIKNLICSLLEEKRYWTMIKPTNAPLIYIACLGLIKFMPQHFNNNQINYLNDTINYCVRISRNTSPYQQETKLAASFRGILSEEFKQHSMITTKAYCLQKFNMCFESKKIAITILPDTDFFLDEKGDLDLVPPKKFIYEMVSSLSVVNIIVIPECAINIPDKACVVAKQISFYLESNNPYFLKELIKDAYIQVKNKNQNASRKKHDNILSLVEQKLREKIEKSDVKDLDTLEKIYFEMMQFCDHLPCLPMEYLLAVKHVIGILITTCLKYGVEFCAAYFQDKMYVTLQKFHSILPYNDINEIKAILDGCKRSFNLSLIKLFDWKDKYLQTNVLDDKSRNAILRRFKQVSNEEKASQENKSSIPVIKTAIQLLTEAKGYLEKTAFEMLVPKFNDVLVQLDKIYFNKVLSLEEVLMLYHLEQLVYKSLNLIDSSKRASDKVECQGQEGEFVDNKLMKQKYTSIQQSLEIFMMAAGIHLEMRFNLYISSIREKLELWAQGFDVNNQQPPKPSHHFKRGR